MDQKCIFQDYYQAKYQPKSRSRRAAVAASPSSPGKAKKLANGSMSPSKSKAAMAIDTGVKDLPVFQENGSHDDGKTNYQ